MIYNPNHDIENAMKNLTTLSLLTSLLVLCNCQAQREQEKKEYMVTTKMALITAAIPNKKTVAIDWLISVKIKNTTKQAMWFLISDQFEQESLTKGIKSSGFSYYHSQGFSKAPIINLYGSPSFEIMYIPVGASVKLENLKIRQNDTSLPKQLVIWQASDIFVDNKSIFDSWLRGLNVHTPPRDTKIDIHKRQMMKEMNNKDYQEQKLTFEDLDKTIIKLEVGNTEIPKFIQ